MKQTALLRPCGIKNADTGEQNPTPAFLIVIISFSNHSMTDRQLWKLEIIYVFVNIPYLLVVHRPHKLGGHNCP